MSEKIYIADKDTLDKVYNIVADENPVYGFIEHNAILNPAERIEYIGANKNYTPIKVTMGGGYSLGSWADFGWLKANKPYMVKSDGTPDYRLDENNYTKREDGTASDVSNASYDGGAFAWARKIYKREYMSGDDRVVMFSETKRDGFEPIGFIDDSNNELEGVWIPMFYGANVNNKLVSLAGTQPIYSKTTDAEKTLIDAFSARGKFFGGSIVDTLVDLAIMFAKTPDSQAAYGAGNSSGYDTSLSPTNGVKQNNVVGGGQFYGTSDGKSLNKIFHSIVLGTYQQWMRDPYVLLVNGRYKVSKNYTYDLTGAKYTDTGISLPKIYQADGENQNGGAFFPHKYHAIPGFGSVPVYPYKGSTATGGCDGLWQNVDITAVSLRFGNCNNGAICGLRYRNLNNTAGNANWNIGAALTILSGIMT